MSLSEIPKNRLKEGALDFDNLIIKNLTKNLIITYSIENRLTHLWSMFSFYTS